MQRNYGVRLKNAQRAALYPSAIKSVITDIQSGLILARLEAEP